MAEKKGSVKKKSAGTAASKTASRSVKKTSASGRKAGGKASAGRKSGNTKARSQKPRTRAAEPRQKPPVLPEDDGTLLNEIFFILAFAICVLLFVGNLGIGGTVGTAVSSFFFGLFGIMNYIFPACLFAAMIFIFANRGNPQLRQKIPLMLLLFIGVCALLQLITQGSYGFQQDPGQYYRLSAAERTGGGLLGGLLVHLFTLAFGYIGAWILTIVGIVICFLFLTRHSVFGTIRDRGRTAAESAAARREERRRTREEDAVRRQREEALAREDRARRERSRDNLRILDEFPEDDMPRESRRRESAARPNAYLNGAQASLELEEYDAPQDFSENPEEARGLPLTAKETFPEKTVSPADGVPGFLRGFTGKKPEGVSRGSRSLEQGGGMNGGEAASEPRKEKAPAKETPSEEASRPRRTRRKTEADAEPVEDIREAMQTKAASPAESPLPGLELLNMEKVGRGSRAGAVDDDDLQKLEQVFRDFGVDAKVTNVSRGPSVTRYEVKPGPGVKVSRINALNNDIKLNLAAAEIRIEAPIPGKDAVGIEVPNKETSPVLLGSLLASPTFQNKKAPLAFAVGKDLGGGVVVTDIEKMPHLLIAGATGSGKSVCINTLIVSVLYKSTPEEVRMLMIDPKVVELKIYDGIPHLLIPVVTDPKKAAGALNWAVSEMVERYNRFAEMQGVRDLASYNERIEEINKKLPPEEQKKKMARILIIVDELADLMMVAPGEVEDAICRLAQLARAAGLHLVIATQRPSVNVVTGLIKANMPSRIALAVSSGVDSRTIIDMNGAEKLLGKGDMLFYPQGYPKPARVQGAYVSDREISRVVEFLTSRSGEAQTDKEVEEKILASAAAGPSGAKEDAEGRDEYFVEAGRIIIDKDKASIGMLQRMLKIGFNRAARIMDQLADAGVVGPEDGTKARRILMTTDEFERYVEDYV